jgi:hypothetical protein
MRGRGKGVAGSHASEYRCAHVAQINFGDLHPYFTYESKCLIKEGNVSLISICTAQLDQQECKLVLCFKHSSSFMSSKRHLFLRLRFCVPFFPYVKFFPIFPVHVYHCTCVKFNLFVLCISANVFHMFYLYFSVFLMCRTLKEIHR